MKTPKDGGYAYPVQLADAVSYENAPGMTMRQAYKIAALNALVEAGFACNHKSWDATAKHAGIIADAMIAEDHEYSKEKKL